MSTATSITKAVCARCTDPLPRRPNARIDWARIEDEWEILEWEEYRAVWVHISCLTESERRDRSLRLPDGRP